MWDEHKPLGLEVLGNFKEFCKSCSLNRIRLCVRGDFKVAGESHDVLNNH
jgi:hypothetical protein